MEQAQYLGFLHALHCCVPVQMQRFHLKRNQDLQGLTIEARHVCTYVERVRVAAGWTVLIPQLHRFQNAM